MTFDEHERELLARLADQLIPAGEGFPSASEARVAHEGLDQVLMFRPDLALALKSTLTFARDRNDFEAIEQLKKTEPALFAALAEFVPGAYFLNEKVRQRLGYHGQTARAIDHRPDYLDDGLLQSVIDRGPIYRPTPEGKANSALPGYDPNHDYDWNYEHAPDPVFQQEPAIPGSWNYCGLPVASPLGIAAGPLLNGRWILYYASLGFDVLTYKTVRSRARASYAMPNLQPIAASQIDDDRSLLFATSSMQGSWAVSFGMPSKAPEVWRADVEATRKALPKQKLLSVSVVATPEPDWNIEAIANDFALCARWAIESGADCIEANFSCPNVASAEGQLYQQPDAAAVVAARLRTVVGARPLLIKIGHVSSEFAAATLAGALAPHVHALVMVNCISAKVVDTNRQPLFDGEKRGIAGEAIRDAALNQIKLLARVIREQRLNLPLVGVGGIRTVADVRSHLQAGSHAVQLATAAMLNPTIALEIRRQLSSG